MKTYIYIIVLVLSGIPGMLRAQHSLQPHLNMFRANDLIFKQQIEYKNPGRSGENVLWDFSQLNVINDEYEIVYSTYNDTVITGAEHLTQYHYVLQNDSLLLWGFDNQSTQLHNLQPELLLKFPVNYGNEFGSCYYAHGQHGNRLELDAMGTIETKADSYGMMILPSKDTLKHVLRTRTVKYIAENIRPISELYYEKLNAPLRISSDSIEQRLSNDSVIFVVETFRWYENGYRYPVFETVRSWQQHLNAGRQHEFLATAFFYPPQEHYYLEDDEENLAVMNSIKNLKGKDKYNPLEETKYNIFPNPVSTMLNIEIFLPIEAKIKIQVRSVINKSVYINEKPGKHAAGTHGFQFNVSHLPPGHYLLNIWADNYLLDEVILKQ